MGEAMTCDEAKNLIAIDILGDLDPAEESGLKAHLAECPACARAYARTSSLRLSARRADEPRFPDWGKSWDVIARESFPEKRTGFRSFGRPWGWAYAATAFLAVFVLGYFAGRHYLGKGPEPMAAVNLPAGSASPWEAFADSLEPIFIDFLNRGETSPPPEIRDLREKSIHALVSETRLLKSLAERSGDETLWNFLDELENILVSLSNLKPGDRESAALLERTIRDREMRSKLRELSGVKITL
jgi:hypothetical protein